MVGIWTEVGQDMDGMKEVWERNYNVWDRRVEELRQDLEMYKTAAGTRV